LPAKGAEELPVKKSPIRCLGLSGEMDSAMLENIYLNNTYMAKWFIGIDGEVSA
jgi:hypothetical protein|tara:strand:+ start:903 stop:1064 length:162 start_codon:yes stop_codon:yes gene_type:complete